MISNLNELLTDRLPFVLGHVPIKLVLFVFVVLLGQHGEAWLSAPGHKEFI